jgi:hypothetical protein
MQVSLSYNKKNKKGCGKLKIEDNKYFEDYVYNMNLYNDYFIVEPFQDVEYDFRLQKVN